MATKPNHAADLGAQRLQRIEQDQQAMNERLDQLLMVSTKTCGILGDMLQAAIEDGQAAKERHSKAVVEAMELGYKQGYEAGAGVPYVDPKEFTGLRLVATTP